MLGKRLRHAVSGLSLLLRGLFALSATTGLARAESPLTVFAITTKESPEQARLLTDTMKAELSKVPSLAFAESSESFTLLALALKCTKPLNEVCSARIANHLKAPRLVWGFIEGGAAEFHYFAEGREIADRFPIGPALSREQAGTNVRKFVRRAITKAAEIRLTQVSARAAVELDGRMVGFVNAGENFAIDVPPGTHSIVVKRDGVTPFSRTVKLEPLQEWSVPVLWQGPEAVAHKGESGAVVAKDETKGLAVAPRSKSSITRAAGAWTLVGVGVAGIGFGIFGHIRYLQIESEVGDTAVRLKSGPAPSGFDPCNGASEPLLVDPVATADLCRRKDTGDQWSRVGWIATGVGAAALATGLVLLFTAPKDTASDSAARGSKDTAKTNTLRITDVGPSSNGTGVSLSGVF